MTFSPLAAIVWAQWRTSRNFYLRAHKGGVAFQWLMGLLWYGLWVAGAGGAGFLVSGRIPMAIVERALPGALFLVAFFWQLFPIVLASQGAFLDMRRLLVYPIPNSQLFLLEAALRVTTAIEMILISAGLIAGLLFNREAPLWGSLAILVFMAMNLLVATGIKSLLERLFKKRGVRELLMVVFLGLILVPQFFAAGLQDAAAPQFQWLQKFVPLFQATPWAAAAQLALGRVSGFALATLAVWTAAAYLFARLQFSRSLQLEEGSGGASAKPEKAGATWLDPLARWPSMLLLDPVAALVEKDIRSLGRAPRFRLIFLMASTFGAVLWLPQAMRSREGWMAQNYVTMATLYGMLVLGEVLYWNVFGFERASVQQWFATPVRFADVLRAKNVVAVFYTMLAVAILSGIAAALPIGVGLRQLLDALAAVAVFLVFVLAVGNLTSVYMPRPIDARQAWRNNSGKTQFLLLFAYPLLTLPVALAHLARWAAGSYWAYHAVLAVSFLIAVCFYAAATATAEEVAEQRKEQIVGTLSQQEGPVALGA